MAYCILCSASGDSGTVIPLAIQAQQRRDPYPTTLRVIYPTLLVRNGPLIPYLEMCLPLRNRASEQEKRFETLLRNHFSCSIVLQTCSKLTLTIRNIPVGDETLSLQCIRYGTAPKCQLSRSNHSMSGNSAINAKVSQVHVEPYFRDEAEAFIKRETLLSCIYEAI